MDKIIELDVELDEMSLYFNVVMSKIDMNKEEHN